MIKEAWLLIAPSISMADLPRNRNLGFVKSSNIGQNDIHEVWKDYLAGLHAVCFLTYSIFWLWHASVYTHVHTHVLTHVHTHLHTLTHTQKQAHTPGCSAAPVSSSQALSGQMRAHTCS